MATERITDQQILTEVSSDAAVLVIQKNEAGKEVLYETNIDTFIKALKTCGITDGFIDEDSLEQLKPDIIKEIKVFKEKIVVKKMDGTEDEYSIDTYPLVETLSKENCVFVTQSEEIDGKTVMSGARITFEKFIEMLKNLGINRGLFTSSDFENEKGNIVKSVSVNKNVVNVVQLNGNKKEYVIDTTFFDSANVDEEGYLHLTKQGKEVIPAILIPALRKNIAEITCRNVGYVFEEEEQ